MPSWIFLLTITLAAAAITDSSKKHDKNLTTVVTELSESMERMQIQMNQVLAQMEHMQTQLNQTHIQLNQTQTQLNRTQTQMVEKKTKLNQEQNRLNRMLTQPQLTKMEDRIALLERANGIKAAFRAHLPATISLLANAPIHFQLVESTGGGFSSITGHYTAPFSGWYTFECQLIPTTSHYYNCDLFQNGQSATRSGDVEYACTIASTLHAKAGDVFWMQTDFNANYYREHHSFFSASLVVPDE